MDHVLGPHSDCVSELAGGGGGGGGVFVIFSFLFARLPLWLSFIARPRAVRKSESAISLCRALMSKKAKPKARLGFSFQIEGEIAGGGY